MWIQILQRFLILCLMLAIVSVIAFLLPYMAGGDPARTILFSRMRDTALDPHAVEALRTSLGLDRPLYVQYFAWLSNALRGDLGFSFTSSQPVAGELLRSLGVSVTLALTALAIAVAVALPLGTLAAMRPGGRLDNFATLMIQTFVATPEYWFAPMSALVFALYLGWLPSAGWDSWRSLVLPALTLTLRPLAYFTQVTRAAMAEVLRAPYITAAQPRAGHAWHGHAARHPQRLASGSHVFALWLAGLLGGSVVVEVIFAIPGMGRLLYDAVVNRDIPMLQGGFICIVALSILINTLADSFYVLINPAMRGRHDH